MSEPTRRLVEGFAELLAAADIGLAWDAEGEYPERGATAVPIYVMAVPQSPDSLVTISPLAVSASATLAESEYQLQIRSRSAGADPRAVWALNDAISGVLLGNFPLTLPSGVRVDLVQFMSSGDLGQDANNRWLWTANYLLSVHVPTPYRR